ncbi:MAG: glycosyltransferase family 39 protein [Nitrospiraceae bacterium]|nr:glycosyltransferase family 39 protein [Nitrospiraceae bacterium]
MNLRAEPAFMPRLLLPILAVTLLLSLFRLGSVPLFDVDEAVFSEAAREMVEGGDWITPTYNGVNRYDKPILFYWLMATSYRIFGVNEFGARFPSALAGVLLILCLFLFSLRSAGREEALHAAVVAALSLYFLAYSRAAVTDMALTLFIGLSLFSFYRWSGGEDGKKRHLYGFYLFSSLAFLTKGLIGILFPFSIAIIYTLATEGFGALKRIISPAGAALFIVVSGPWYGAQLIINGREFVELFFIKHHFTRFTGVISGHSGPFYYYIPVLLAGLFPWAAYLPSGVGRVFAAKERVHIFAFVWFSVVFLFFSLSTTKLPNYILPALPAASLLIAAGMTMEDTAWDRVSDSILALLAGLLCAGSVIARPYVARLGIIDTDWLTAISGLMLLMAVVSLCSALRGKRRFDILSGLMLIFLLAVLVKGLPLAGDHLQGSLHKYSLYARENLSSEGRLAAYAINNPSVVFYSRRRVLTPGDPDALRALAAEPGRVIVITRAKESGTLTSLGFTILEKDDRYAILERK